MRGATIPVTAKVNKLDTSMIEGAGGAITLAATVALSGKIMTTGQDFESAMSGLTAITGSTEKAAKEFEYLKEQSNRLGLDLLKTARITHNLRPLLGINSLKTRCDPSLRVPVNGAL
jgi:hypothetical protein